MNKLTKIGASALCGSLAAIASANAGGLSVKGGATATWSSNSDVVTGNPIGMASGMTFTGSGELDNGTSFAVSITHGDQKAYSGAQISLTTPSMGTFTIDQSGGGIDRYDDMMPSAWEEVDGTSLGMGLQTVTGVKGAGHIDWDLPSSMLPDGISASVSYSPRVSGGYVNDKSVGGSASEGTGAGWDFTAAHSGLMDGLNVFAGYSTIEKAAAAAGGDNVQTVLGATYATGAWTVGYQISRDNQKSIAEGTSYYDNNAYGVSFAVNDNLSLSYGMHKSKRVIDGANNTDVELEGESIQMGYTMGGATISIAETSVEDGKYNTANDLDGTTVALSLAF